MYDKGHGLFTWDNGSKSTIAVSENYLLSFWTLSHVSQF
jgi:hypothetical protein